MCRNRIDSSSAPSLVEINTMSCKRPDLLTYDSMRGLYLAFQELFLGENTTQTEIRSACGHDIRIFDHHFFHLVKLDEASRPKPLLMRDEKAAILGLEEGFGTYTHDRQRAIYLRSAIMTLRDPDEVWEDDSLSSARWVYLKEFDSTPYNYTILLIGIRADGEYLVPVTSFAGKPRDAKRWRRGRKNLSLNTTTTRRWLWITRGDFTR